MEAMERSYRVASPLGFEVFLGQKRKKILNENLLSCSGYKHFDFTNIFCYKEVTVEAAMDERDKDLIAELRRRLPPDVMNHIRKMIAFGSRVQGNAEEDSDLDLLILVDYKTGDLEKRIEDVAYQLMWDHDFNPILSIKVLSENRYSSSLEAGYSFFKNVEREGVAL